MSAARTDAFRDLDRRMIIVDRSGVAAAVAAQLVLVGWTLLLADTVRSALAGERITSRLVTLAVLVALRASLRTISTALLARSSDAVRRTRRREIVGDLVAAATMDRRSTTGEDGTLIGSGIDALDDYITRFRPARATATLVPLVVLVIVGVLDPLSMAILLFTGPMLIGLLALIGSRTRTLTDRRLVELGWLRAFHLDMVRGIPTLRIFGRSREGARSIGEISDRFGATTMDVLRTAFQTSLVIEWAATAATALVAVQVGLRLVDRHIGFAAAFAVLLLTPEFFAPFRSLAIEYHSGQAGLAALDRMRALHESVLTDRPTPSTRRSVDGRRPTPAPRTPGATPPSIVFDHVTVSDPDGRSVLVESASLTVAAGETVALVGASGAGKSTLTRVLLALHRPDAGVIQIDGVSLDELEPDDWRRRTTFVTQRPAILAGTVADAIALSRPGATYDEIVDAARTACADEMIDALPFGYETPIGEGGVRLSGGQRQRLAIARAVLRAAPVVILDEFTAHLDPTTEADVVERIAPFLAGRTTILISHRTAPLRLADRILTLRDATITETVR